MRVLVLADRGDHHPGHVGDRLEQRGASLVLADRDDLDAYAETATEHGPFDLLLHLGSIRGVEDDDRRAGVEAESRLVRDALLDGVPTLGICYGAQLLAHALGGEVGRSPRPEVGLYAHESYDDVLCPAGPWVQFRADTFTPPPTARVLGVSDGGCQGFTDDSRGATALAWQFHPEVTLDELRRWMRTWPDWVERYGSSPAEIEAEAVERADDLRERAYALTDAALDHLGVRTAD